VSSDVRTLLKRLDACPPGAQGWRPFEEICTDTLSHLFVPPLGKPIIQPRTYSGIDRRDAVFPNRNFTSSNNWAVLLKELEAEDDSCRV